MIFDLSNIYDQDKFKEYVNKLFKDKAAVELKKHRKTRTGKQNRYLHVIIGYFACFYGVSLEEAKLDYYKRKCNPDLFIEKHRNKLGFVVEKVKSSTELDTEQMALSITRFRNWSASVAGLYLPSADEDKFLLHAEQVMEENKEFL